MDSRYSKTARLLGLYTKFVSGQLVRKSEESVRYGVNERSIQRDIDDIRSYIAYETVVTGNIGSIVYDRAGKGYRLDKMQQSKLGNGEVLAVCKILLDSRAFTTKKMKDILHKLVLCCVPEEEQKKLTDLIRNEAFHYVEPRHKTNVIDTLWILGQAIREKRYIELNYKRTKDKLLVKRQVQPLAIMFSEYYFYLAALIVDEEVRKDFENVDDVFPTIYRVDRIKQLKVLDEKFQIPYRNRFEEGEFRKRIQFMYGGRLRKLKLRYTGTDVDAILDRLPTAKVIAEEDGAYIISAEVFGKGIDMWLRSQEDIVQLV